MVRSYRDLDVGLYMANVGEIAELEYLKRSSNETELGFCWPSLRIGQVLSSEPQLDSAEAKTIGPLFEAGETAMLRYVQERIPALRRFVETKMWRLMEPGTAGAQAILRRYPKRFEQRAGRLDFAVKVEYRWVPIVTIAGYFLVSPSGYTWFASESLTICGRPSKSKVWCSFALVEVDGSSTMEVPVSEAAFEAARSELQVVMGELVSSFVDYYRHVLNQDAPVKAGTKRVGQLEVANTVEIVSLGTSTELDEAFGRLRQVGLGQFTSEVDSGKMLAPSGAIVAGFLEPFSGVDSPEWTRGQPKFLDIFQEENHGKPLCALVVPWVSSQIATSKYRVLTPLKVSGVGPAETEISSAIIARDFGRYY
jgi:hypothetical protein